MSRVAVFEPDSPQEAYEYYKHAAALAMKEQPVYRADNHGPENGKAIHKKTLSIQTIY